MWFNMLDNAMILIYTRYKGYPVLLISTNNKYQLRLMWMLLLVNVFGHKQIGQIQIFTWLWR